MRGKKARAIRKKFGVKHVRQSRIRVVHEPEDKQVRFRRLHLQRPLMLIPKGRKR